MVSLGNEHRVLVHRERAGLSLYEAGQGALDICRALRFRRVQVELQRQSGMFHHFERRSVARIVRIQKHAHTIQLRQGFLEELQPFGAELANEKGRSGDVAAWTCKAVNQPSRDGVAGDSHHDGNRGRRSLGGAGRGWRVRHQNVWLEPNQLDGQLREACVLPLRPSEVDHDVLALDVAQAAKPFSEGST